MSKKEDFMKKLSLLVAAMFVSALSLAEVEKVITVKVGGREQLIRTANKLGEFVGYPLGAIASMALMDESVSEELGDIRDDAPITGIIYLDSAKQGEDDEENLQVALVVPTAVDKAQFIAKQFKHRERDGVIKFIESEGDEPKYVVFSEDEKWLAMAETRELALLAATDIPYASADMAGDVARMEIAPAGVRHIEASMERECDEKMDSELDEALDHIKAIERMEVAVRLNDLGLDLHGAMRLKPDTELDRMSRATIEGGDVFVFAPQGAVAAFATTVDEGAYRELESIVAETIAILERNQVDLSWLKRESADGKYLVEVDAAKLVAYLQNEEALAALDQEKIQAELEPLAARIEAVKGGDQYSSRALAISFKDRPASQSPAEKFARVLPEAQGKPLNFASVYSLYAIVRAVSPEVLKIAPEEQKPMIKAAMLSFADNENGAFAAAAWREEADYRFVLRVSADELRAVSSVVTACIGVFAKQQFE
jgi:hypothetical protein